MTHILELPAPLYAALERAAIARGVTPVGWIAAHLSAEEPVSSGQPPPEPPKSLADLFAGRVGRIASTGAETLSEECGQKFAEHLEEKRKAGQL